MAVEKEYTQENPNELERAPEHKELFEWLDPAEYEGTIASFRNHGCIHPVVAYKHMDEKGINRKYVIDGMKQVEYAKQVGIKTIFVCMITCTEGEDKQEIAVSINRNNHDNYQALYRMIQARWVKHFKGQGFRSDIREEDLDEPVLDTVTGKRLNIYQRIGRELNLSGTKVKHIRKVGMVNPLYFERIEVSRYTLFAAYYECVKEERDHLPPVPSVEPPVYITSSTRQPQFSEAGSTPMGKYEEPSSSGSNCNIHTHSIPSKIDEVKVAVVEKNLTDPNYILVRAYCQHCQAESIFRILKTEL